MGPDGKPMPIGGEGTLGVLGVPVPNDAAVETEEFVMTVLSCILNPVDSAV